MKYTTSATAPHDQQNGSPFVKRNRNIIRDAADQPADSTRDTASEKVFGKYGNIGKHIDNDDRHS